MTKSEDKTIEILAIIIRGILAIPFVVVGNMAFWIGEWMSGDIYTYRADEVREDTIRKLNRSEIVICSAVISECGKIIRGHRHYDCFRSMESRGLKNACKENTQGFITSRNRFVDRKEGLRLQIDAGIKSADKDHGNKYGVELFSEDLY